MRDAAVVEKDADISDAAFAMDVALENMDAEIPTDMLVEPPIDAAVPVDQGMEEHHQWVIRSAG